VLGGVAPAQVRPVLVVSRDRVLRETVAARELREAERQLSVAFQVRVDAVKQQLADEEANLARERPQLPPEDFAERARAFDLKSRHVRRESQRQAAQLQQAVRRARDELVSHLAPILIRVVRTHEADIVLEAEQVLIASPAVNVTDEVIRLFDETVTPPEVLMPDLPDLLPPDGAAAPPPGTDPDRPAE
jgi:Skp family chaperone for outer membrane proteins